MKVAFASVYHPQFNGTMERANSLIFKTIKKILEGEKKGKWVEVMPTSVWSHNTTVCKATNFTLFRLMYGAEAVLPEEIKQRPPCAQMKRRRKTCLNWMIDLKLSQTYKNIRMRQGHGQIRR
jgi:hypothetical protein